MMIYAGNMRFWFFGGCGVLAFDLTFFFFCLFKNASMGLRIELFLIGWRMLLFHAFYGTVDACSEIDESHEIDESEK